MPKLQKSVLPLHLDQYRVWVVDTDSASRFFRLAQMPDVLTGGKNAFLINGSPELISSTDVLVEIKDSDGNVVFSQPIKNYSEGLARVVSIEVYKDTPSGMGTITILGQLKQDARGNLPPAEFAGAYNVKWSRAINIAPFKVNTTPIRLYRKPDIQVAEILAPYRYPESGSVIHVSTGSIEVSVKNKVAAITSNGFTFNRFMVSGSVNATINGQPFTTTIGKVVNSGLAFITTVPTSSDGSILNFVTPSAYSISYASEPIYAQSQLSRSFADITINKLTTFSGDIARSKVYVRSIDQPGSFQQVTDVALEELNLLTTQSLESGDQFQPLGLLVSQSIVDAFWEGGSIAGNAYVTGGVTLSYNSTELLDSMFIASPTGFYSASAGQETYFMGLKSSHQFFGNLEYTLNANLLCVKPDPNVDSRIDIYLTGTAFPAPIGSPLGVKLASYYVPVGETRRWIDRASVNFMGLVDGTASLKFVIHSGKWFVSDVSITSARETGFNPDEVRIVTPVEGRRFERLVFKAELFDNNNNYVPIDIVSTPVYFDGGNTVVRGSDSRIDGILTVAPSGSGPTLTSKGFFNRSGSFTEGQAIFIGPLVPTVKNKNTAFFAGTSSAGPEFSVGDKLYGYYDYALDQFILEIDGIIRIGSGSNYVDIRTLVPSNPSFRISQFLSGSALDFYDVRGINSVSAGRWNDQIARMGYYTRGYTGFVSESALALSAISTQVNPYQFPTQSVTLFSSGTIPIPVDHLFFNETLYASASFQITQLNLSGGLSYVLNYQIDIITSWNGYPNPLANGQTLLSDTSYFVGSSGSFPPITIDDYPIFVPRARTSNTLYTLMRLKAVTYPTL